MNRILECVTMIIVAMLLSIGFTGQHSTYAEAPLRIKVNVVYSIQDIVYPDKDNEPTEIELLTTTLCRTGTEFFRLCGCRLRGKVRLI